MTTTSANESRSTSVSKLQCCNGVETTRRTPPHVHPSIRAHVRRLFRLAVGTSNVFERRCGPLRTERMQLNEGPTAGFGIGVFWDKSCQTLQVLKHTCAPSPCLALCRRCHCRIASGGSLDQRRSARPQARLSRRNSLSSAPADPSAKSGRQDGRHISASQADKLAKHASFNNRFGSQDGALPRGGGDEDDDYDDGASRRRRRDRRSRQSPPGVEEVAEVVAAGAGVTAAAADRRLARKPAPEPSYPSWHPEHAGANADDVIGGGLSPENLRKGVSDSHRRLELSKGTTVEQAVDRVRRTEDQADYVVIGWRDGSEKLEIKEVGDTRGQAKALVR